MEVKLNQEERRRYLIDYLIKERKNQADIVILKEEEAQKELLRSLMNVRMPARIEESFLQIQDEYLKNEIIQKGITRLNDLEPIGPEIYLWNGDITTLECGAIVNAANSGVTGCYSPCHNCIDNCIHTYSGIQLRNECNTLMKKQGYLEPVGEAKITLSYNLPCDYVIHTVGPIVRGELNEKHCELLKSCYVSCLKLADENNINSIAFCCISTGVFGFPKRDAAEIAVKAVNEYKNKVGSRIEVIFNVFTEEDERIYRQLFRTNGTVT